MLPVCLRAFVSLSRQWFHTINDSQQVTRLVGVVSALIFNTFLQSYEHPSGMWRANLYDIDVHRHYRSAPLMDQPGFLGTQALLKSDLTLLAYIILLVPLMLIGFVFARRKMFVPYHKLTMTTVMIVNWVLIAFVMAVSYSQAVAPELPEGLNRAFILLPTIHLITGGIAQILATILVIRMWFEHVLPPALKFEPIKPPMRWTLALWLITAGLGVAIYLVWYTPVGAAMGNQEVMPPVATEDANAPANTPEADANAPVETPEADADAAPTRTARPTTTPIPTRARTATPQPPAETVEASS